MAKLSVYVPDELMDQVKALDPNVRPSAVLQDALRARVVDERSRPYAQLSDELARNRDEARRVVLDRVTAGWRAGYGVGVEFARSLPWQAFEDFAALDWDLAAWRSSWDATEYDYLDASPEGIATGQIILNLDDELENAIDNAGAMSGGMAYGLPRDSKGTPIGLLAEGFVDGIRDVWEGAKATRSAAEASSDDAERGEREAGDVDAG